MTIRNDTEVEGNETFFLQHWILKLKLIIVDGECSTNITSI